MTHLVRGSIAAWDCKHFIEEKDEAHEDLQCNKGYDECAGRNCPDFSALNYVNPQGASS